MLGRVKPVLRVAVQRPWRLTNPVWRRVHDGLVRLGLVGHGMYLSGAEFAADAKPFETIHRENRWDSDESASGQGSTLAYTAPLRAQLPGLLRRYRIGSLLDAPCGDLNWITHVAMPEGIRYIGGDIVPALIAEARARFPRQEREFALLDIVGDDLPEVDLWLCRDVLFHLPNEQALQVLRNFAQSRIRYLLTTTYSQSDLPNRDIAAGGYRHINLRRPPFSLPEPLAQLDDFVVPLPPRYMALWSREQVASALADRTGAAEAAPASA